LLFAACATGDFDYVRLLLAQKVLSALEQCFFFDN
jgi:hypothetical protein